MTTLAELSGRLDTLDNQITFLTQDLLQKLDLVTASQNSVVWNQQYSSVSNAVTQMQAALKTLQSLYVNLNITVSNNLGYFTGHTGLSQAHGQTGFVINNPGTMGQYTITENTTPTIISTPSTWTLVQTTGAIRLSEGFTTGAFGGRLIYTGITNLHQVGCTLSLSSAGNNNIIHAMVIKNGLTNGLNEFTGGGVQLTGGMVEMKLGNATDVASTAIHALSLLETNDYLELYVMNDAASDLTIKHSNLFGVGNPS